MLVYVTHQQHFCPVWRITLTLIWLSECMTQCPDSQAQTVNFFSDYWSGTCIAGRQPHQAGIHQRRSMPCVYRSTVFLHGRPQIWRGLFDKTFSLFINENGFGSVSKLSFDFTDFVHWYITSERWNIIFIYRVTFSFNFSLLIRMLPPDTYLSALRQSKYSLVRCYGDILPSLLFCEQII